MQSPLNAYQGVAIYYKSKFSDCVTPMQHDKWTPEFVALKVKVKETPDISFLVLFIKCNCACIGASIRTSPMI